MAKIAYTLHKFSPASMAIITQADAINREYERQGFTLTLRQLYYQFVARDILPNKDTEYKRLGDIINEARLAGYIDWSHMEDRTRNLLSLAHYEDPADRISIAARTYRTDLWEGQENYVEVWVEKEALAGIVQRAANALDVPYFSCRGYVSQSEMHAAGMRLRDKVEAGKHAIIIHLGDHDPSGQDMTRDIEDRLRLFMAGQVEDYLDYDYEDKGEKVLDKGWHNEAKENVDLKVDRIALNMEQIRQYKPPPNPAKLTDSRCAGYIKQYGDQSWELDALDPNTLNNLIQDSIRSYMDVPLFNRRVEKSNRERTMLIEAAAKWRDIEAFLDEQTLSEEE